MDLPMNFDENWDKFLQIQFGKTIGNGTFGLIQEGFWNGEKVAIKNLFNVNEKQAFISEIENLCRIKHDNIIKCLGYSKENVQIVMEFAENGSLHDLLYSKKQVEYNLAHALNWALQCAEGINYLHTFGPKPILHRDLKTLNLLLMNNYKTLKICDFGTSCGIKTNMTNGQGTASWMAPEVIRSNKYDEKCDVFSWAIILWQVLSRQLIYSKEISFIAIMWLVNNGSRPPFLVNCPYVIENLLKICWSDNPSDRPSMKKICEKMNIIYSIVKKWVDVEITNNIKTLNHENYINEDTIRATNHQNEMDFNNFNEELYCTYTDLYSPLTEPPNLHLINDVNNLDNKENINSLIKYNTVSKLDCMINLENYQLKNDNQNNYSELQIQISQPPIEIAKIHDFKIDDIKKDSENSFNDKNVKSIPISITSRGKNSLFFKDKSIDEDNLKGCINFVSTFSKFLHANKINNANSESKFYLNNSFDSNIINKNNQDTQVTNLNENNQNVISEITLQTTEKNSKTSNLSISTSYNSSSLLLEFFKNQKHSINDGNNLERNNCCNIKDKFDKNVKSNNLDEIDEFKNFENSMKKMNESNIKYKIKSLKNFFLTSKSFM